MGSSAASHRAGSVHPLRSYHSTCLSAQESVVDMQIHCLYHNGILNLDRCNMTGCFFHNGFAVLILAATQNLNQFFGRKILFLEPLDKVFRKRVLYRSCAKDCSALLFQQRKIMFSVSKQLSLFNSLFSIITRLSVLDRGSGKIRIPWTSVRHESQTLRCYPFP